MRAPVRHGTGGRDRRLPPLRLQPTPRPKGGGQGTACVATVPALHGWRRDESASRSTASRSRSRSSAEREPARRAAARARRPLRPRDLRDRRLRGLHGRSSTASRSRPASCSRRSPTGAAVTTAEGLAGDHPVARAFAEAHAFQCGFCTPGMVLTAARSSRRTRSPTDEEIRLALAGNLCRCGCYVKILEAVRRAAALTPDGDAASTSATSGVRA